RPRKRMVEKIAATATARRNAWKTRASARSRRSAPRARATAEETPAPMPLLVVCRTIITQGNASDAPASALVPMRPRKNPSNMMTPANARSVRMFGAARRKSVGRIGPSSSSLVRAAADGEATFCGAKGGGGGCCGAKDSGEIAALRSLIGAPRPAGGLGSAWTKRLLAKPGGCNRARPWAQYGQCRRDRKAWFLGPALDILMMFRRQ